MTPGCQPPTLRDGGGMLRISALVLSLMVAAAGCGSGTAATMGRPAVPATFRANASTPRADQLRTMFHRLGIRIRVTPTPLGTRISDSGWQQRYGALLVQIPTPTSTKANPGPRQPVTFCRGAQPFTVRIFFVDGGAVLYSPRYSTLGAAGDVCRQGQSDETRPLLNAVKQLLPGGAIHDSGPIKTIELTTK
jgi:hypothetical protein